MRDAKDVRIDRERLLIKRGCHHHAGRFSSDAGERFELLALARHVAAEAFEDIPRAGDDVLRLHAKETGGLDDRLDVGLTRARQFLGRWILGKEGRRRHIDARVGGLSRKNDRDEQLKLATVRERGYGVRIQTLENRQLLERDAACDLLLRKWDARHAALFSQRD